MKHLVIILTFLFLSPSALLATEYSLSSTIKSDFDHFYSPFSSARMSIALLIGAGMANTDADTEIQQNYRDELLSEETDDAAEFAKLFGEKTILIPLSLASAALSNTLPEEGALSVPGRWGVRASRAYLVGAPTTLLFQVFTGASRPDEGKGSDWRPFEDNNGVSGHAFVGAVPFLTLTHMTENWFGKGFWFACSTASAWSRVNDNKHFASQAFLGWYVGFESTLAVASTEWDREESDVAIVPVPVPGGAMLAIAGHF